MKSRHENRDDQNIFKITVNMQKQARNSVSIDLFNNSKLADTRQRKFLKDQVVISGKWNR